MNSGELLQAMSAQGPVLLDGAWATQLQERGLSIGGCADCWNLSRPKDVAIIAERYMEAGAQILLTNTFGANRISLERHGMASSAREINRAGAAISLEAASQRAAVFGSIGPSGRLLR